MTNTEWCPVCGYVEGSIPHEEEPVGNLAGVRLVRAKEYVLDHTDHTDDELIPWDETSEAITHIQQLRNRELDIGYLAQLENGSSTTETDR